MGKKWKALPIFCWSPEVRPLKKVSTTFIAASFLVLCAGIASFASGAATPRPGSGAPAAPAGKMLKVWQVKQTSNWGTSVVKACADGIRIEANTGSILVAKAPTWEVVIFRKGQKKASRNSFEKFITKYPHNERAENFRGAKKNLQVSGVPSVVYIMRVNRKLDANDGFGHTFQAKLETPFVTNMYMTVAADSIVLPRQVKEIWRTYFEFSYIEKVPIEYSLELADGSKRYQFQTLSQKYTIVPASEFDHPRGLDYSAEFMQIIYGQKMEDVADLLMSP